MFSASLLLSVVLAADIAVQVGGRGNTFSPAQVDAAVGDVIYF